ncbi:hypoxanthine phosphoribosyltransferase [candidate division KSB1 bacterium]|nr:hypoxanthine phosphoribosyltransferase [candidate division KSB1 bacterium]RQW08970.1 MAG: hypoxanthine phosphoribosyltransferase [candidate division KSB1 bacterium]
MDERTIFERAVLDGAFRVLITREELEKRIQELGRAITKDYRGKDPIVIGILNGCFVFIADLVRTIELDLEIDFLKISSYGDAQVSSGQVTMLKDVNAEIGGRHVLVVEDIVDTGVSLKYLEERLQALNPASLKFVTLLYKKEKAKIHFDIDYVGFEIPDEFVIGYGLDHKQILRNLPAIYVMD